MDTRGAGAIWAARTLIAIACMLIAWAAAGNEGAPAAAEAPGHADGAGEAGIALLIDIDDAIGPAVADHVRRGLAEARARDARVVVLRIDTPGGLDTSMRTIIRAILASPVPVIAYVAPSGARAASAGAFILYASHVAAMAPGTNVGAATPVSIGGGFPSPRPEGERGRGTRDHPDAKRPDAKGADSKGADSKAADHAQAGADRGDDGQEGRGRDDGAVPDAPMAKAINDAVAYIRSLAELRGRNADWAERAVRDAASLSASAALAQGVIDFVANDLDDALRQADGRKVATSAGTVTITSAGLATAEFLPDWRTRFLGIISNPNLALILLMIGAYGLLFEFMNPGALVPGTVGAICLVIGLYALSALPLTLAGATLLLLGLALLVAEAFLPSFGVIGIGGIIAFVAGAVMLVDVEEASGFAVDGPLIAGIAVALFAAALVIARAALRSRRRPIAAGAESLIGESAEVLDWSAGRGFVIAQGERWQAVGPPSLAAGQRVRVSAISGLTLAVQADQAFQR